MDPANEQQKEISIASLVVLAFVTFLTSLYLKGLDSGVPLYYDSIGGSATLGGTFVAIFTLASTVMRLFGGQITDHFAHYRVLMISLIGLFIGAVIPIISDEFYVVVISRIIQGACFALSANVVTVTVMGSASKDHIGKRLGIRGVGTSLGTMFGALVATALLDHVGYDGFYGFFAAIVIMAMVSVILLKRKEESVSKISDKPTDTTHGKRKDAGEGTEGQRTLRDRLVDLIAPYLYVQVVPYLAISFAWRMMRGFCIAFILIFCKYVDLGSGALFFVAAGATTMICRIAGGRLFDSNKAIWLLPFMGVEVIGFAMFSFMPTFPMLIVSAICYGVSIGTASPFVKALAAKATPKEHWGVVNGELFFFGDIGKALGAFCGGLIIDATAKTLIPEIALGFAVFGFMVTALALLFKHIKKI